MKRIAIFCAAFVAAAPFAVGQASTASNMKKLSAAALAAAEKTAKGVAVSRKTNTLNVTGMAARLVVRTGPENDMMSYRIQGLRNPTIKVRPGAKLRILFVNTDEDMPHNLRFTAKAPPYDANIGNSGSNGSADLPHKSGSTYTGQEIVFTAPRKVGTSYYICTIPGHAAAGMYGKLVVKN